MISDSLAARASRRLFAALMISVFVASSSIQILFFLRDGRGHPVSALNYIADQSGDTLATVGGDVDARIGLLVEYFTPLSRLSSYRYLLNAVPGNGVEAEPDWIISHHIDRNYEPIPTWHSKRGTTYQLVKRFPTAGLSGFPLFLYRRND